MRIAICMIVKNEEAHLRRCLESVKGLGNIYIVDTGSTDSTCAIAREYTDKVFENEYKWNDSFCEARNYVLGKANEDWILSIDADEYLEGGQAAHDSIRKMVDDSVHHNSHIINVVLKGEGTTNTHMFPRLFQRSACRWEGAIHNYLNIVEDNNSDIVIVYGYSEAHKKDPDRAFRILSKEVQIPGRVRELYYLAREYWYKKDFDNAIKWYNNYLKIGYWAPEISDAYLMIAKCFERQGKRHEARMAALKAININADYREALEFMADAVGPKNSEHWLYWAYHATDTNVLFINKNSEKGREHYEAIYSDSDFSRYEQIYEMASSLATNPVIDVGCGIGELSKYCKDYQGFDFCDKAVQKGRDLGRNVYCFDIYGQMFDESKTIVAIEVLEHINDIDFFKNVSPGTELVISVPSFHDSGHLRRYTEKIVMERYSVVMNIDRICRFNWNGKAWDINHSMTNDHITLFRGIRK